MGWSMSERSLFSRLHRAGIKICLTSTFCFRRWYLLQQKLCFDHILWALDIYTFGKLLILNLDEGITVLKKKYFLKCRSTQRLPLTDSPFTRHQKKMTWKIYQVHCQYSNIQPLISSSPNALMLNIRISSFYFKKKTSFYFILSYCSIHRFILIMKSCIKPRLIS